MKFNITLMRILQFFFMGLGLGSIYFLIDDFNLMMLIITLLLIYGSFQMWKISAEYVRAYFLEIHSTMLYDFYQKSPRRIKRKLLRDLQNGKIKK